MRQRNFLFVIVILVIFTILWNITNDQIYIQERSKSAKGIFGLGVQVTKAKLNAKGLFKPIRRPCPNQNCPLDHFPFHIRSGAATAIGPKICFNGQVVMGGTKSNMGRGLNIVVIEGETGKVLKYDYFNMYSGNPKELLNFLKTIVPGNIVLIASFDDPATKLTDEIRDIFEGFGSSMIKSLKFRDSWVFAGAPGLEEKSPFEKRIPNDSKTNVYGQWPELVEMDGCFPRKI